MKNQRKSQQTCGQEADSRLQLAVDGSGKKAGLKRAKRPGNMLPEACSG
jgi:hypothetical protein